MAVIYVRKSTLQDLDPIMEIINEAKALLKKDGSPQWQDGHPNQEMLTNDINKGINWVLIVGDTIAGVATLTTQPDPNYKDITEGAWKNNDPYATIHRVAIRSQFRGMHLSKFMFSNLITIARIEGFKNLRIDTHQVNARMQKLSLDCGFEERGIIHVKDKIDTRRLAFELNL